MPRQPTRVNSPREVSTALPTRPKAGSLRIENQHLKFCFTFALIPASLRPTNVGGPEALIQTSSISRRRKAFSCALAAVLSWAAGAPAQEAIRMSLAGEQAARARRAANTTLGYYNLRLGPTAWRFNAALGAEGNDNIRNTGAHPQSDLILRPELETGFLWPLTDQNALSLRVGAGYSAYLEHSGLSRYFIRPGSELSFDIYAGDFTINLHDRFSIIQDAYQDPTIVGSGGYSRLDNAIGTSALWDLNQAVVRAGFDHVNHTTLSGNIGRPDGQQEVLYSSAGYNVGNLALAGVELGGALIDYQGDTRFARGGVQWNAGLFADAQVSEYLQVRASGGYTVYAPDPGPLSTLAGDYRAVYFDLSVRNRLNQHISQTLSAGRSVAITLYGYSVDSYYARWRVNWRILRQTTLSTTLDYQHGKELEAGRETFDWFGGGLSIGRPVTRHLSADLAYSGHWRNSNLPSRNYLVNTIGLQLRYAF